MEELAVAFAKAKGITLEVIADPTNTWLAQAKGAAHIVFSGSDNMMLGFVAAFEGRINVDSVEPLCLRPATILVRKTWGWRR